MAFAGVTKAYREGAQDRVVLDGLHLEVPLGGFSLLYGKSGSGKSTLLNLACGIDLPDAGTVWVAGRPLSRLRERERTLFRRREVGFVFQFFNLIPTLTASENLLLPLELNGVPASAARRRAREHLALVGLADRAHSLPDQLSGGEQQRVAVARALVHDPALILADEPTGNLDAENGALVLELLAGLCRDRGKTLLMVTHSREAETYAQRVFTLSQGRVTTTSPEGGR